MATETERAIEALLGGGVAVIPTDTVYGLVALGRSQEAAARLYALKGREETRPTALLFASVDVLKTQVPGIPAEAIAAAHRLLPGPFTLVLPVVGSPFPWLSGPRSDAIGIRIPILPPAAALVLDAAGCLVATSANEPGGADPCELADVVARLRAGVDAVVDGGTLPGVPSTVLDLTGPSPVVLREGAVSATDTLALLRAV